MFSLLAIKTFLGSVPREVYYAIAAGLALLLIYNTGRNHGEAEVQAAWDAATRAALENAREADTSAREAVDRTRNNVGAQNNEARNAAESNPDDPLGAGLNRLRSKQASLNTTTCNTGRVRNGTACA